MSVNGILRKHIISSFKLNGFSLRSDACDYFISQLSPLADEEREEWLEKVIDHIQEQSLAVPVIEKSNIEAAILYCCKSATDDDLITFNVINAFDIPQFVYNLDRKKFLPRPSSQPMQIFGNPVSKCNVYKDRYTVLKQRTVRHELFSGNQHFQLQPAEYLLSSSGTVDRVVILGMLTQLKEGRYYIEDSSGCVPLDLSQTSYQSGFFTENCFVLVEGSYRDKILYVQAIGFPPPEPAEVSRIYFGSNNIFGGIPEMTTSGRLKQIEQNDTDAMIIFLADIWLDQHKVIEKLRTLFSGYEEVQPTAMILMGNFLSSKYGSEHIHMLKSKLKLLADLLAEFPLLITNTHIVIVPGPEDCLCANILPRPLMVDYLTEELKKNIPNIHLATNPCRIQYCTQEIVVIREDLVTKMCRNCIHFPTEDNLPLHFARTVISQAHLAPLPLSVCPVYWDYDVALRLYPLPDVVVVADQMKSFSVNYMDCSVLNPGSFSKAEFIFKVYYPSSRQVEDSQIPED